MTESTPFHFINQLWYRVESTVCGHNVYKLHSLK